MSLRWFVEEGAEMDLPPGREEKPRPGRFRWWVLLLLLALVTLSFFYFRQRRLAQAAEQQLVAEVTAGFHLWQEAVSAGDEELFITLLATTDPLWQQTQRQLFLAGRLLDRTALGLHDEAPPTATIIAVDIAPDWEHALVRARHAYQREDSSGAPAEIYLEQFYHFERRGYRWLMTAPDAGFWGTREALTGDRVTISVPGRDAALARRLQLDLERDIAALCPSSTSAPCLTGPPLSIYFDPNPSALQALPDLDTPVFQGETFRLPTPSLVGLPADDQAYSALYYGYTHRLLNTLRHQIAAPLPFPDQQIVSLCFPAGGHTIKLFSLNPETAAWTPHLTERNFRFLSPAPDGRSVILQEYGRDFSPNHLRLLQWQGDQEIVLYDATNSQRLPRPVGWAGPVDDAHLLIHSVVLNRADIFYHWLDRDQCTAAGCPLHPLPGYTIWSPSGAHTLVSRRDGLWLGDGAANLLAPLEEGNNPFWLNETTFGYARYAYPDGNRPVVEVVLHAVDNRSAAGSTILFTSADLSSPTAGDAAIFIDYVTPLPGRPGELFVSGPALGQGRYYGFRVNVSGNQVADIRPVLDLPDALRGHPGLLTPTGYAPFSLSPDGQYLITGLYHEPPADHWSLFVHDLDQETTQEFTSGYPTYPAQYPYYDWSQDGNWLLVVDDGFFRLIAPAHSYERLLPYQHDACFFSAWAAN